MKLTEKQKRFADYYIELGNATEAAIRAGYSKKTAKEIASENLTKPNIKQYVEERLKELDSKRIMNAEEVMQLLTSIARNEEMEDVVVFGESGPEITSKGMSAKDRLKALELLGKRYLMWSDKNNQDDDKPIEVIIKRKGER